MKKTLTGWVRKSDLNIDNLLTKDDMHIRLEGSKIDVKKDQHHRVYDSLNMPRHEMVKVEVTIKVKRW